MTRKYRLMPAVLAGALGLGSTIAWGAEPTTAELMDQIQALQTKVQQLENRQTTISDAQVSATIQSVLSDAERRSQLFQMEGFTAGHDGKNFWLRSSDGNYTLSPRFQFQFRGVLNSLDGGSEIDDEDDETIDTGFEVRRMKIEFVGNAITPMLTYNFRWATENGDSDSSGGGLNLENAYVQYEMNDQWSIKAGQFKENVYHEENTSSKYQLAADRSLANELIGGGVTDYVQGVAFIYATADSPFRGEIALTDGANSDNTSFLDGTFGSQIPLVTGGNNSFVSNFGVSGRFEWASGNNWEGYDDFSARGNKDNLLVVGGGVDFTQSGDQNFYFHTIDFTWEGTGGLSFFAAYLGQYVESGDDDEFFNWGGLGQVGYAFNENWEVFGRYSYVNVDEDLDFGGDDDDDDLHELTAGVNYFFKDHAAKFTVDVGWLPEGSPAELLGIGVRAGGEDQFYVRAQFQLLI